MVHPASPDTLLGGASAEMESSISQSALERVQTSSTHHCVPGFAASQVTLSPRGLGPSEHVPSHCPLMGLSLELRLLILEYLVAPQPNTAAKSGQDCSQVMHRPFEAKHSKLPYPPNSTDIFLASKQPHEEALYALHRKPFFHVHFDGTMTWDSLGVGHLASKADFFDTFGILRHSIRHLHLHITVTGVYSIDFPNGNESALRNIRRILQIFRRWLLNPYPRRGPSAEIEALKISWYGEWRISGCILQDFSALRARKVEAGMVNAGVLRGARSSLFGQQTLQMDA